jgi:hypothetical protein
MVDLQNQDQILRDEGDIVDKIKEWLWNDPEIVKHVNDQVKAYWADSYGINTIGPKSDLEEEFICQCQVVTMNRLLAKVLAS